MLNFTNKLNNKIQIQQWLQIICKNLTVKKVNIKINKIVT